MSGAGDVSAGAGRHQAHNGLDLHDAAELRRNAEREAQHTEMADALRKAADAEQAEIETLVAGGQGRTAKEISRSLDRVMDVLMIASFACLGLLVAAVAGWWKP